jgi:multidrug efflux pump subunit AcrB
LKQKGVKSNKETEAKTMTEQNQIQVLKKRNRWLAFGLGGVVLVFAIFCLLMYFGPITGNVFSSINSSLSSVDGYGPAATQAPVMEFDAGYDTARALDIQPSERLIIRNGQLSLTVKDTRAAQKEIEKVVTELADKGAFLVSSSERTNYEGESPYIETVIRIPADRFDEVMNRIAGQAVKVDNRSESAEDVTAEYVDLNTRLESLEAARQRLLEIMKQSATTEELLQAEQQLTQRETEIESIKGRMKFLSESAKLSSITINLYPYSPSQPLDNTWRPAETFRGAVETLVNSLRGFADFLIVFIIAILPWLLVIGAIWWGVARVVRKRRERKTG